MVGYTNEENPFGDHNLNQQFVWKKKAEKDGVDLSKMSKRDKTDRQHYFLDEIQKVRRRRSDREAEQEEMERLKAEESRLREAEMYADWHQKETISCHQIRLDQPTLEGLISGNSFAHPLAWHEPTNPRPRRNAAPPPQFGHGSGTRKTAVGQAREVLAKT